eukprot:XP_001694322.1 predicted protein [Chlamydomonas reinhardtii]
MRLKEGAGGKGATPAITSAHKASMRSSAVRDTRWVRKLPSEDGRRAFIVYGGAGHGKSTAAAALASNPVLPYGAVAGAHFVRAADPRTCDPGLYSELRDAERPLVFIIDGLDEAAAGAGGAGGARGGGVNPLLSLVVNHLAKLPKDLGLLTDADMRFKLASPSLAAEGEGRAGQQRRRLRIPGQAHDRRVVAVGFNCEGRLLATAGEEPEGHSHTVLALAWHPLRRTCIASAGADRCVLVWDTVTKSRVGTMEGHTNAVLTVAWSGGGGLVSGGADKALLASGGDDSSVRLWDPKTGKNTCKLEAQGAPVAALAWSPHGRCLAVAAGRAIRWFDIYKPGEPVPEDAAPTLTRRPDASSYINGGGEPPQFSSQGTFPRRTLL